MVVVRGGWSGFAEMEYSTSPGPEPAPPAGAVMTTQSAPETAVQAHPACVVTVDCPFAAAAPGFAEGGLIAYVQATPAWLTVKVWPPMVMVVVRAAVVVFACTSKFTSPGPVPDWVAT